MRVSNRLYRRGEFEATTGASKTVVHAVTNDAGQLVLPDGSPLPPLRPNCEVELRFPLKALSDQDQRRSLDAPELRMLLPAGTKILVAVQLDTLFHFTNRDLPVDREVQSVLEGCARLCQELREAEQLGRFRLDDPPQRSGGFLELELWDDLIAERRGQKVFRLQRCRCLTPALNTLLRSRGQREEHASINQALTRTSELLELHRATHTANAFRHCYVPVEPGLAHYVPLDALRD